MEKWVGKKKAIYFMLFLCVFTLQSRSALAEDISLRCQVKMTTDLGYNKWVTDKDYRISVSNNDAYMIDEKSQFHTKYSVQSTGEYFFFRPVKENPDQDTSFRISRVTGEVFSHFRDRNLIHTWTGRCESVQFERKF
jgi:hypothetical protein